MGDTLGETAGDGEVAGEDCFSAGGGDNAGEGLGNKVEDTLEDWHLSEEDETPCQGWVKDTAGDAVEDPDVDAEGEAKGGADKEEFGGVQAGGGGEFHGGDGGEAEEEEEEGAEEFAKGGDGIWREKEDMLEKVHKYNETTVAVREPYSSCMSAFCWDLSSRKPL